jgi:ring-1,2-phenylacetyl-CoA epoxidase subunit PaaB
MTEGDENVYDRIPAAGSVGGDTSKFEVFHLSKRGKQHVHAGTVHASTPLEAMQLAKHQLRGDKVVYNVWAVATKAIRFTQPDEQDLWLTLPEKKFRDAADYKAGEKLKSFLDKKI